MDLHSCCVCLVSKCPVGQGTWVSGVTWELFANPPSQQKLVCIPLWSTTTAAWWWEGIPGWWCFCLWGSGLGEAHSGSSAFPVATALPSDWADCPPGHTWAALSLLTSDGLKPWLQPEPGATARFCGGFAWGTTSFPVSAEDGSPACPTLPGLLLYLSGWPPSLLLSVLL